LDQEKGRKATYFIRDSDHFFKIMNHIYKNSYLYKSF